MGIIESGEFRANVAALKAEQTIRDMAAGMVSVPRDQWLHDTGTPRWEFTQAAETEYTRRGGTSSQFIGSVAYAVAELCAGRFVVDQPTEAATYSVYDSLTDEWVGAGEFDDSADAQTVADRMNAGE